MVKKKNGDWAPRKVNYVEFDDEDEQDRFDYDFRRVIHEVSRVGKPKAKITPTEGTVEKKHR